MRSHNEESEHKHDLRASSRRSLWIAFALISSFMIVEVVGGLIANSLALLADAGHMVTDAAAIGLALLAIWMARQPSSFKRTFGFHRTETLAALLNVLSLWLIAAWCTTPWRTSTYGPCLPSSSNTLDTARIIFLYVS